MTKTTEGRQSRRHRLDYAGSVAWLLVGVLSLSACAPRPTTTVTDDAAATAGPDVSSPAWQEEPPPDGPWRPHSLARCSEAENLPTAVENCLAEARLLFNMDVGSDAIMELELCLEEQGSYGLQLLALAQLYVLAGQGEPELLPTDGPAADVGDWPRNQARLLQRAEDLLAQTAVLRSDDSVVAFLLADAARARGAYSEADSLFAAGRQQCSRARSLQLLQLYQGLGRRSARLESDIVPRYPEAANRAGISGDVVLDLLINPWGQPVQFVTVASPDADLTAAAVAAAGSARYAPAQVGKYPIWSWLRLSIRFELTEAGES